MTLQIVRLECDGLSALGPLIAEATRDGHDAPAAAGAQRPCTVFAAVRDGEIVGVGACETEQDPARIFNVYVRRDARRSGVGRALAGALTHESLEHAASVELDARDIGAAAFWAAMGFAAQGSGAFRLSRSFAA